jgi:hypothetical protein
MASTLLRVRDKVTLELMLRIEAIKLPGGDTNQGLMCALCMLA